MSKRRLGKGIDALLQGRDLTQLENLSSILNIEIDRIHPNPDQPRKHFPDETLRELADSIREKGIIQPILAEEQVDGSFVIIAGERRYRAAKIAGLLEVPVITHDFSEDEKLEIALIENIQREDLNPIDEARALQRALEHSGNTQDELARRLGKSRSALANTLRLLKLDTDMQDALADGRISAGHARALLAIDDPAERAALFARIQAEGLSVRDAEFVVRGDGQGRSGESATAVGGGTIMHLTEDADAFVVPTDDADGEQSDGRASRSRKSVELVHFEEKLMEHFGGRVTITGTNTRGRIAIDYLSTSDFERIISLMHVRSDRG